MENKILNCQFEPMCAKQTRPNTKIKQKSSMTNGVHKNGATVQNVKRCQPVKNECAVTEVWQLRHFV